MNNIEIGLGTAENILTALESIGFTVDTTNLTASWDNDTNNKLKFKIEYSGTNPRFTLYNSANARLAGYVGLVNTYTYKITYELIGAGIIFGFHRTDSGINGNNINYVISAPVSENDDWQYVTPYHGTGTQDRMKFINGRTENYVLIETGQLYSGSPLGIQIVKAYDGNRFVDNLFLTSISPNLTYWRQDQTFDNNFQEATIGTDTFIIINLHNSSTNITKISVKKVAS